MVLLNQQLVDLYLEIQINKTNQIYSEEKLKQVKAILQVIKLSELKEVYSVVVQINNQIKINKLVQDYLDHKINNSLNNKIRQHYLEIHKPIYLSVKIFKIKLFSNKLTLQINYKNLSSIE